MAQDDFEQFVERVKQAESGGRRYGKDGKLLTSPKGAQGEMQVMPGTQRAPGFGVEPAKNRSGEELARVGKDYLKAMEQRYGNREYAAVAYNWGPGKADKWIAEGADFSKLPKETQDYVKKVAPGPRTEQQQKPTTSPEDMPDFEAVGRSQLTADLGAGYKAALALSFLGDEEDSDEKKLDEEEKTAAKELADYKSFNALNELEFEPTKVPMLSPVAQAQQPVAQFAEGGEVQEPGLLSVSPYSRATAYDMYPGQQGQFDQQDAARHMLAAGTLARKYGPGVAEMLGQAHEITTSPFKWIGSKLGLSEMPIDYEQDLHNNKLGIELARRSKSQKDLEDLVQMEAERARQEKSPGAAWVGKPVRRADGGDAEPTPEELAAASRPATFNPKIVSQGAAARQLAAMRDVNTLPDPRTYAAVSGFLGTPPDQQGFSVMHPDLAGIKKAGEAGFYAGTAAQVAPVVGGAAKMLGKLTGSALNERMLAGESLTPGFNTPAPINFAVKPKGGTVLHTYSGEADKMPITKLDELLADYRKIAARDHGASDEVVDFIRQKAPRYFTTTYGTADDPLRTAIRERAIEPFGRDVKRIPPYLVDAAKFPQARGHLQAKHELERMYDELTGVNPIMLKAEGENAMTTSEARRLINQKMAMEGVPAEAQNAPSVTGFTQSEFADYPYGTELLRGLVENQASMPSNIQHALRTGEVMYDINPSFTLLDPHNVVDALKQIPPNKLKSMSFPEALIQGTQALAPVRDYRAAIDMADRGAKLPPTVLQQFTKPVETVPHGTWVQITDPVATELEGKLMKHSVGGYSGGDSYGTGYTGLPYGGKLAFDDDLVRVYSLRDKTGEPTITVEMARPRGQEGWNVTQVRGRFNSEPGDKTSVFQLFDKIDKVEGLDKIKPNSYNRSSTGADLENPSIVDWARGYDNWLSGITE